MYRDITNSLFPRATIRHKTWIALLLSVVSHVFVLAISLMCMYIVGVMDATYINHSSAVTGCVGVMNIYCAMYPTLYGIIAITNMVVYLSIIAITLLCMFPLIIMGFLKMLELHKSYGLIGLLPSIMVAVLKILDTYKELSVFCLLPLVLLGIIKVVEMKDEYYQVFNTPIPINN